MKFSVLGIIAAAGRGSRMNSEIPKPLTMLPIGKTMLDLQIEKLARYVDKLVVVTNELVTSHEGFQPDNRVDYIIQESPTGMGDAVFCASSYIENSNNVAVLWVDQVGMTEGTIEACINLQKHSAGEQITIPVLIKNDSYIGLQFANGILTDVRQAREGDFVERPSLSDSGFFCLSAEEALLNLWRGGGRQYSLGRKSSEYNFLPFLVYLSARNWKVSKINATMSDSFGVNNYSELQQYIERGSL